jgi:NAD-dependent dihydropyrimidine dehydrogenase PreA subunit
MGIERIDVALCNGCGICVDTCSEDVLSIDETLKKAVASYPEDCMQCAICELECPQHAIRISPIRMGTPGGGGSW